MFFRACLNKHTVLLLALVFSFAFIHDSYGDTITWTGLGQTTNASEAANWSGGTPDEGDDVVFNSTAKDCMWDINPLLTSLTISTFYDASLILNDDLRMTGTISVKYGTLKANNRTIKVGGDWGFYTGGLALGDVDGDGDVLSSDVGELILITLGQEPEAACSDVNDDREVNILDIVRAQRIANGLDPEQPCEGGTFIADTGEVILDGVNQTIYGNNTFNDLKKLTGSADTLSFEAGSLQTILGNLTLNGASTGSLTLTSSEAGQPWYLDAQGNRNISYASISYLSNVNFVDIVTTHSSDEGNNLGVSFGGGLCVCREGELIMAKLACGNGRQPC